jgi:hypothetical protein
MRPLFALAIGPDPFSVSLITDALQHRVWVEILAKKCGGTRQQQGGLRLSHHVANVGLV